MCSAIVAPAVGEAAPVLNLWFVHAGDHVYSGDRVVELLLDGSTFDISAPETGVLAGMAARPGAHLVAGQVLGWIEKESETT